MSVKYFGSDALNKLIDLVKTALGLKADDSNVVHKTGDETVAGEKSFTDRATFSKLNNDTPIYVKGNANGACIGFTDSSDGMCGYLGVKNDNKPYFFNQGAKRLALLEEVPTDSDLVHKTGTETISGLKTFSDLTYHSRPNSDSPLYIKGSSDQSWIGFTSATGDTLSPFGYLGVKNDNKPYFFNQGAKRLALLDETMPFVQNATTSLNNLTQGFVSRYCAASDSPSGSAGWFGIMTIHCGYLRQLAFPISSNKIYARYNDGSSWSSWKRMPLSDETMPYYYKYVSGQTHNCNDWTSQGIYVDYNVTNAPLTGWVTIVTLLAGYPRQICYPYVSNTVYSRYKNSSTWSSWVTISQIYTLTTEWVTLENYTWIRSAGGMYYVSGGIDIGLSSGNTIISITIADWSTISANYVIQPYRSGGGSKIGLMSNTDSFNDNSALKFIVSYV